MSRADALALRLCESGLRERDLGYRFRLARVESAQNRRPQGARPRDRRMAAMRGTVYAASPAADSEVLPGLEPALLARFLEGYETTSAAMRAYRAALSQQPLEQASDLPSRG
ncbi:hypothetical protein CKO40_08920 [Halochromatium glycolicum]|uniref:Uncharacterized protein n=1 Tax=Halochromatium glycolicum TaxID=85075 RepID=A0AAJ0U3L8_9GAMM|nr:hypothetical protein [Halochromatium glycolicum]